MDSDKASAADSNHMVNIMPQTRALNRGAWAVTEVLAECYREQGTVWVIGGVFWGDDPSNDFFVASLGWVKNDPPNWFFRNLLDQPTTPIFSASTKGRFPRNSIPLWAS